MVWAAIGMGWRSPLVILPAVDSEGDAYRLNSDRYIRLCLAKVVGQIRNSRLQQDGAKSHTSRRTTAYLEKKGVYVLHGWPSSSPMLNVIENLWAILKRRIAQRAPTDVVELKRIAKEEWAAIDVSTINNLILSYRKRLKDLVNGTRLYQ
jgi:transposase